MVGQILILCRTCMMRKWSSIKTKTKPLARPGKKAVARSKHCRWILTPCCPISGKWGATRLIHVCFMAKHCQIKISLRSSDRLLYFRFQLANLTISKTFNLFVTSKKRNHEFTTNYVQFQVLQCAVSHSSLWAI